MLWVNIFSEFSFILEILHNYQLSKLYNFMTGPSRWSFFENLSVLPGRSPAIYVLSVRRIRGLPISTARTCPGLAPVGTCTWDANRKKNPKGGCRKITKIKWWNDTLVLCGQKTGWNSDLWIPTGFFAYFNNSFDSPHSSCIHIPLLLIRIHFCFSAFLYTTGVALFPHGRYKHQQLRHKPYFPTCWCLF